MVSPFPFYLLRKGWQDRATIDVAWRDPINRHDWVETGGSRLIRSNGLRMTSRFREIELGAMGLEESSVGAKAMFVRLAQHRARKRGIIRMLQKVRTAKLIIAAYQLKRNQMGIEQRMQVAAQQNTVAGSLRLGTRAVLDMRSFERFVDIATRDGASTGIGLKELRAETLHSIQLIIFWL